MRIIIILLTAILFTVYAPNAYAEDNADYFSVATEGDVAHLLDELKIDSCEQFLDTYFTPDAPDNSVQYVRAMAYDSGLCVEQDLERARELYEIIYQNG